jgi:hypothetical protein
MVLTEGFLLGIANGGVCLAYCAPVLVPNTPPTKLQNSR